MKVVMVTPFRPEKDGVGDCSVKMIPEMFKEDDDLDVTVVSKDIGLKKKEKDIHRIIYRKSVTRNMIVQMVEELKSLPRTFSDVFKTLNIVGKEKADIVHVQHEPGTYNLFYTPMLLFFLKFSKAKTVVTMHGRDYSLLSPFHRTFLYPWSDSVVVHTKTHKSLIGRKDTVVIPMGISDLGKVPKWKFDNRILFFGFASPHKGLDHLVKAFKEVSELMPKAKLQINGPVNPNHTVEVEYQKKIKKMIVDMELQNSVSFQPKYTEREDLPKIRADIVAFPYKKSYSAGQSAAMLDCIAAGKAVIVTKVPGIHERIENGVNGLVVPPENEKALTDAMLTLLGNKGLLKRIHKNNVRKTKEESWREVSKMMIAHYKKILSS